jgi:hypothetical protein
LPDVRLSFRTIVPGLLVVAVLALAACGSSSNSSGGSTSAAAAGAGAPRAGGPFASLTSTQRSCLNKQGLSFGGRRPPNGQAPGGPPPGGAGGQPPAGGGFRNSARFKKMQTAFKKCGVKLPSRPPGGGPPPQGGTGTTQN